MDSGWWACRCDWPNVDETRSEYHRGEHSWEEQLMTVINGGAASDQALIPMSALAGARVTRRELLRTAGGLALSAASLPLIGRAVEGAGSPSEIKLGAIYPLSGNFANVAVEFKNAAEMALDFVNGVNGQPPFATNLPLAKGQGIPRLNGAKLKIVFTDSQGKPELAQNDADRLIKVEKCVGLFGCYTSATTVTASQVAERYGVPFMNPDSSSPRLTRRGLKWFVRIQPDDIQFSKNFFDFLKDLKAKRADIKATRLALLHENTTFGKDAADAQMKLAQEYGYEIVGNIEHPTPASQVTSDVEKLKAAKPDILLQTSYFAEVSLFLKAFRQLDFSVQALIGNDAGYTDESYLANMKSDGDYAITRAMWADDIAGKKELAKKIGDYYKQKYKIEFTENAGLPFMGVLVFADALNRAGSIEPGPLMKAIMGTQLSADQNIFPWGIKFDASQGGQNTLAAAVIAQVQKGKYVTVWPFDVAAEQVIWPVPPWSQRG
jgi:branched-chain amino acid transport system substrate-binding protein